MSVATGGNAVHPTDRLARRGFALIEGSAPAQASDYAIAELSNTLKSFPRSMCPRLPVDVLITSQLLRTWGGDRQKCVSAPFPFFHVVPRWLSSLFVTESEVATELFSEPRKSFRQSEKSSGSQKADVNG